MTIRDRTSPVSGSVPAQNTAGSGLVSEYCFIKQGVCLLVPAMVQVTLRQTTLHGVRRELDNA